MAIKASCFICREEELSETLHLCVLVQTFQKETASRFYERSFDLMASIFRDKYVIVFIL